MTERTKRNTGAIKLSDFNAVRISVASPEKILQWSYGEVLKPETINYRTQKPERDGLFDERIFGPTKDWECYCGKYKKIRYKGVVCDKCGVEVTRSSVRRERMGHIELASAVAHIWYVRGVPSVLSQVLDLSISDIEKVIYFAGFIILDVDEELRVDLLEQLEQEYEMLSKEGKEGDESQIELEASYKKTKQELNSLTPKTILSEVQYQHLSLKYGNVIRVGIGAESLLELLKETDLKAEIKNLKESIDEVGETTRKKLLKRLKVIVDLHEAKIDPQSLILQRIPVIPPDLRPMVQLDGGRFAASDLNDLYRRVLNRNNRLKKLLAQGAPEVICRNEKRMLQEAVDALIDNSARRNRAVSAGASQRRLRSLSDMLRGKQGRFRQNLLGKRVDYSGRSVIVVGPELKLNQCGLPKTMALELFKPFVISELVSQGYIQNVKNASRLIEKGTPEVWDVLEQVTKEKYVLLNRAPTLHRLGIQAFQPILIEGKAIQLHPLVCYAYNADFDGDQMAVHVPLSAQAMWEAGEIMQSSKNLLKPASGEPVVSPRLDMVFGSYYLTSYEDGVRGEGRFFSGKNEAILAYQMGNLHVRAKVKVKMKVKEDGQDEMIETSVGRILFNNVIPKQLRHRNVTMDSKNLKKVVNDCFVELGVDETAQMVDRIKDLGYEHALRSGMTFAIGDINIPSTKDKVVDKVSKAVDLTHSQYMAGLISNEERRLQTIRSWNAARDQIGEDMIEQINPNSPVFIAADSGARGSSAQLNQMGGMKGLVVNPAGDIIETPIISNYKEGLSELEYFISTHGARKGKADTALRTSDAGYLTRRLVDVSQDVITTENDCESSRGLEVTRAESAELGIEYATRLAGRVAFKAIKSGNKQLVGKNQEITNEAALAIQADEKIESVAVRSPIYCESDLGICQLCYGRDLATGKLVEIGEVVGIMAAQAIGEPGTQLTLKTFHTGGVSAEDITTGLPRVDELFEARSPKSPAIMSDIDGRVKIRDKKSGRVIQVTADQIRKEEFSLEEGFEPTIKNGELVKAKQIIASNDKKKSVRATFAGKAKITSKKITVEALEPLVEEYNVAPNKTLKVKNGDVVTKSQPLTEGHLDLQKLLKHRGVESAQRYIIAGIQQIYLSQGQEINDKHIEIILRQMFSKAMILNEGQSKHIVGQVVDRYSLEKEQKKLDEKGKEVPVADPMILGVTRVALTTKSFLSAASFQETTSVLINAAIKGAKDELRGLKENVIIGRLIPAGTGFKGKRK